MASIGTNQLAQGVQVALICHDDSKFACFHGESNLPGFRVSVYAQPAADGYTSSTAGRQYCKYWCRTAILQVLLADGNTASTIVEWQYCKYYRRG